MRLTILFLILMMSSTVMAFGVGPVQVYKEFKPGGQDTVALKIFNQQEDLFLKVYTRGEMKDYISIKKSHDITAEQGIYELSYTVHYPDELLPGPHYADIVIEEVPLNQDAMIQSVESHISKLRIQVPYDEPFAEAKMIIEADETSAMFKLYVQSYTKENINAFASIDIMKDDIKVKNIVTRHELIQPMNEERYIIRTELVEGLYTAVANVLYSEKTIRLVDEFIVGRYLMEISDMTIDPFVPGEVAAINIHMKNFWPAKIRANGRIDFYKNGKLADSLETHTFEIEDEKTIPTYWDTAGKNGNYTAIATIFYGDSKATKDLLINLDRPQVIMWWILPAVLLAIICCLVYWKFYSKSI